MWPRDRQFRDAAALPEHRAHAGHGHARHVHAGLRQGHRRRRRGDRGVLAEVQQGYRVPPRAQRGGIRSAPSRRMTSPLSIAFSAMWTARAPYSSGAPRRAGCGTWAPSAERASCGRPASSGVSNRPGAIVQTRTRADARSRAAGSVMPTTPPLEAEYASWPIWPSYAAIDAVITITP